VEFELTIPVFERAKAFRAAERTATVIWMTPHTSYIYPARISELLEEVSLNTCLHMWFQQDGAQLHYSREMGQWLPENNPGYGISSRREATVNLRIILFSSPKADLCVLEHCNHFDQLFL
jgi:hypothetical protein